MVDAEVGGADPGATDAGTRPEPGTQAGHRQVDGLGGEGWAERRWPLFRPHARQGPP
jgi:hypothetical protein